MSESSPTSPSPQPCQHRRQQFRKVPGSRMALLYCLDCEWQKSMSMDAALKQVLELKP